MPNDKDIRFRLPAELKAEAHEFCAQNGVSVGAWLRALMKDSLERRPAPRRTGRVKLVTLSDGTTLKGR